MSIALTTLTQRCKPLAMSERMPIPRAFAVTDTSTLTAAELAQARTVCVGCPSLAVCRDFAYITRMRGFVAGTTEAERVDAKARADAYVSAQRAIAHRDGHPFTHVERARVFLAAITATHQSKVLAP